MKRLKLDIDNLVNDKLLPIIPEEDFKNKSIFYDPEIAGGQIVSKIENQCKKVGLTSHNIRKKVFGCEKWKRSIQYAVNVNDLKGTYTMKNKNFDLPIDWDVGNPSYGDEPGENRIESQNSNNSTLYIDELTKALARGAINIVRFIPAGVTNDKIIKEVYNNNYGVVLCDFLGDAMKEVKVRGGFVMLWLTKNYNGKVKIRLQDGTEYKQDKLKPIRHLTQLESSILDKISKLQSISSIRKKGDVPIPKGVKGSLDRVLENDKSFSKSKSKKYKQEVVIYVGGFRGEKNLWSSAQSPDSSKVDKVGIGSASDRFTISRALPIPKGKAVGTANYYFETNDMERLSDYLEGRIADGLVPWIVKRTKWNDTVSTNKNSFNWIPDLNQFDKNKPIIDQLGLTEEEKNEIIDS